MGFTGGSTIKFWCEVRDPDTNNLYDPTTSMTITIKASSINNPVVNSQDMIRDATGKYHHYYTLDTVGKYTITYKAVDGSHTEIVEDGVTAN